ncbi:hypothetical protein ASO20_02170 [Mycoplasma sp. (ex Biomphalaria glabrata)]|uniref:TIR domain-containing protein n=1 Tax=Mycoplasma sp. (ex Biomphalaria glabrata) TaxID=1749074 RepID=UPI00073ACCE6|nr:TIR domain-containing protein [Mycoplasma sp. (ex Biomphalaria glabrata)]ALV23447.1 hypothetical protein ASO20_02170 [Mycoplasma sp. (ex Biomphalaria glabrata)]
MNSKSNVFISFSYNQSKDWKDEISEMLVKKDVIVDYSEKTDRDHQNNPAIWNALKLRIAGASVTVVLYSDDFEQGKGGKAMEKKDDANELDPQFNQGWIYKEIRESLVDAQNNPVNGILVIMPDEIYDEYHQVVSCTKTSEPRIQIFADTIPPIIKENILNVHDKFKKSVCSCCCNFIEDSYISIIKYSSFCKNPVYYISETKKKKGRAKEFKIRY